MKAGLPATMENVLESETNGNGYEVGFSQDAGGGAGAGFDEQGQIESTRGWWKDVETVQVIMMAEKEGWFLQKYRLESDVSRFGGRV